MNKLINFSVIGFLLVANLGFASAAEPPTEPNIQPAGQVADYEAVKSGEARMDIQQSDMTIDNIDTKADIIGGAAQRVLPTVNKRTGGTDRVFPETNNVSAQSAINTSHSNIKNLRVEMTGWGEDDKQPTKIQDFEKNTEKILENDDNIAGAEVAADHLKVGYRRPAKLFGFIPVAYTHAFTVDGKGSVSNGTPWWLIFATSDSANFAMDVQGDFQKEQSQLRWIKAPTAFEAAIQRFSSISNILKARHDASQQAISNIK